MDIEINCETQEEYDWFERNLKYACTEAIFALGANLNISTPEGKNYSVTYRGYND